MKTKAQSLAHVMRFSGVLTCGLKGKRERFPVASLYEASKKYEMVRDACGLGSSEMPSAVIYCDGKKCATISYNGRVWDLNEEEVQVDPNVKTVKQHDADGWSDFKITTVAA